MGNKVLKVGATLPALVIALTFGTGLAVTVPAGASGACDVGNYLSRACYLGHVQTLLSVNGEAIPATATTNAGDSVRWVASEYGGANQLTEAGLLFQTNFFGAYTQTLMPNGAFLVGNLQPLPFIPSSEQFNVIYNGNYSWSNTVVISNGPQQESFSYNYTATGIAGGAVAEDGLVFIGNPADGTNVPTWTSENFQISAVGVGTVTQWSSFVVDDPCQPGHIGCLNGQWNPPDSGWNSNLPGSGGGTTV